MKKLTALALVCTPLFAFAAQARFTAFSYNIQSDGPNMTTAQCQQYFSDPTRYNIVNDKPVYMPNLHYKINSYQRTNATFLNKRSYLFTGVEDITLTGLDKPVNVKKELSFVLDLNSVTVRGSWRIPGYCKGNEIGVDQKHDKWRHKG